MSLENMPYLYPSGANSNASVDSYFLETPLTASPVHQSTLDLAMEILYEMARSESLEQLRWMLYHVGELADHESIMSTDSSHGTVVIHDSVAEEGYPSTPLDHDVSQDNTPKGSAYSKELKRKIRKAEKEAAARYIARQLIATFITLDASPLPCKAGFKARFQRGREWAKLGWDTYVLSIKYAEAFDKMRRLLKDDPEEFKRMYFPKDV